MVQDKLDHWFRHEYGRTLSLFLTRYGSHHLESIEDAIHDTLYKAMMVWGYKGIPENPSAWIYRVSHNNLLDHFRKKKAEGEFPELPVELKEEQNNEINDEVLKAIQENNLKKGDVLTVAKLAGIQAFSRSRQH